MRPQPPYRLGRIPPAWEMTVTLPGPPPDGVGVRETIGCQAWTRSEARSIILRIINARHGAGLARLPPGKRPRRAAAPP